MEEVKKEFRENAWDIEDRYVKGACNVVSVDWGRCATCDNFRYARTAYDKEKVECGYSISVKNWPSKTDQIIECTMYVQRSALSLQEMASMAHYIDYNKREVGFK
jgi:Ni,Fe-hydrogenase III small subunit